jgi:hypothetical protein
MSDQSKGSQRMKLRPMKRIPEADAYVRRNLTFVPIAETNGDFAEFLVCIDGRRADRPQHLGRDTHAARAGYISFPGGGIGIAALILSTLNVAFIEPWQKAGDPRAKSASKCFSFSNVMGIIERSLGGMSGHTDDHALHDPLASAGCGHAKALLASGYGLGDTYRTEMTAYLKELKKRALRKEKGVFIEVYHGKHQESAVLRLRCDLSQGEFLSITANDGEMSVFVFSEHMAIYVLKKVAGLLYEELRADFKRHGIAKEELYAHAESLYFSHVRSSAFKLAHDLPVYDVIHREKGVVEVRKSDLRY